MCIRDRFNHSQHGPKYYTTSDWLGPGNVYENVMKGAQHKVQDAKRYEGNHAQSSIIHNTVQNIILPQIGWSLEIKTKMPYRETTAF